MTGRKKTKNKGHANNVSNKCSFKVPLNVPLLFRISPSVIFKTSPDRM